jgi:uncharacterized protein (DUF934 family)
MTNGPLAVAIAIVTPAFRDGRDFIAARMNYP